MGVGDCQFGDVGVADHLLDILGFTFFPPMLPNPTNSTLGSETAVILRTSEPDPIVRFNA